MFSKLKKFLKSKRAMSSISTAIKVGTACILGALMLVGIYGVVRGVVLPNVNEKVENMYEPELMIQDVIGEQGFIPSIESLKQKYNFSYYSTLDGAIADANALTLGQNADCEELTAEAGLYEKEDGTPCVVLLKNTSRTNTITFSNNVELNLGGCQISFNNPSVCFTSSGNDSNVFINGSLANSQIIATGSAAIRGFNILSDNWTISGGTYSITGSASQTIGIYSTRELTVCNCSFDITGSGGVAYGAVLLKGGTFTNCNINISGKDAALGIQIQSQNSDMVMINTCSVAVSITNPSSNLSLIAINVSTTNNCTVNILNSNISATSLQGFQVGIYSKQGFAGTVNVTNTVVNACGNISSLQDSGFGIYTLGGTINCYNCQIYGTDCAIETHSTNALSINGGTYSGTEHGGFYLIASQKNVSYYFKNATFRETAAPDGYTIANVDLNYSGAYFKCVLNAYVDNCSFEGSNYGIVLKEGDYEDTSLYISNSILAPKTIRIDNGQKVYIGVGNNFVASDTTNASACITTSEEYCQ